MPSPDASITLSRERPLGAAARVLLVLSTIALLLLFYLAVAVALVYLVVVILLSVAVALTVGLRLGFAGWMLQAVTAQSALAFVIARGMFLGRVTEYHLELTREDAPALFTLVSDVARELSAPVPDEVLVDADLNASVQLKGYRAGRGRCRLRLGHELMVALPAEEIRAVIAHELAHARLTQRGYIGWLFAGVSRMSVLAEMLQSMVEASEEVGSRFHTARAMRFCARGAAHAGSRLAATYLRQDEFAADAAAAALCGSEIYARSLVRLHLASQAPPLSWRERVLQSQRDGSYCTWLRGHLKTDMAPDPGLLLSVVTDATADPLRTHPSLGDRLAALPNPGAVFPQAFTVSAAEALLADPDDVLQRLIDRIEETAAGEQRKENRSLVGEIRKKHASAARLTRRVWGGWLLALGLFLGWLFSLPDVNLWVWPLDAQLIIGGGFSLMIGSGIALLVCSRVLPPDSLPHFSLLSLDAALRRRALLQPEYRPLAAASEPAWPMGKAAMIGWGITGVLGMAGLIQSGILASHGTSGEGAGMLAIFSVILIALGASWTHSGRRVIKRKWSPGADAPGELSRTGGELAQLAANGPVAELWRREAERAYVECDFLRALAASRLCLGELPGDRRARMIHAVCSAFFEDQNGADRMLKPILSREGLGPTLNCASGWIAAFAGRWSEAEAYLLDAARYQKDDPSILTCLAYMQWKRGKAMEAARTARRSLELRESDPAQSEDTRVLLARILLGLGRPRHAHEELEQLDRSTLGSRSVRVAGLRTALLLGRAEEVERRLAELESSDTDAMSVLELAHCFLEAEQPSEAEPRLHRVISAGFYPYAHVLLARLAAVREDRGVVFEQIHTAFNLARPVTPGAAGVLEVIDDAFEVLRMLEPPTANSCAWVLRLDLGGATPATRYLQVTVCEADWDRAFGRVRWLCRVLAPGTDAESVAHAHTPSNTPIKPEGMFSPGFYDAQIHG